MDDARMEAQYKETKKMLVSDNKSLPLYSTLSMGVRHVF